jgi:hypothetical protein
MSSCDGIRSICPSDILVDGQLRGRDDFNKTPMCVSARNSCLTRVQLAKYMSEQVISQTNIAEKFK